MRTNKACPNLITNGADEALPYLTSNTFAFKAKDSGKVLEKTDSHIVLGYKDGTKDYIDIRKNIRKNSDGGFYITVQLESKLKAYYAIIKQNEALIEVSKDEKNRLNDRQKAKENLISRLKKIVVYTVEQFGEVKPKAKNKSLSFDTLSVSLKETDALEIEDVNKIPTMYLKVSYVIKYDDADKLENLMRTNSIKFTKDNTLLVEKDVIKDVLLAEKELPVEERKGISGARLKTNVTPTFR